MDSINTRIFFVKFSALYSLVLLCRSVEAASPSQTQKIFKKSKISRDTLPPEDIISTHAVHSQLDCAFKCLNTKACVGYNYRSSSSKYGANCQLSNKTHRAMQINSNGHWTFYHDVEAASSLHGHEYGSQKEPGRSCADILARSSCGLRSGIYWITIGSSKPFPVYCDMDGIKGWTMVFKLVAGVRERPAKIWNMTSSSNEFSQEALNTKNESQHPYKNRIVQNWNLFNPSEVRVVLYKQGVKKVVLRFNASNTDNTNWFSEANILESPWRDILTATKNFFTIQGPCWGTGCRDFHINHVYVLCPDDSGWLSIGNNYGCKWENRFGLGIKLIYSKMATYVNYNEYSKVKLTPQTYLQYFFVSRFKL